MQVGKSQKLNKTFFSKTSKKLKPLEENEQKVEQPSLPIDVESETEKTYRYQKKKTKKAKQQTGRKQRFELLDQLSYKNGSQFSSQSRSNSKIKQPQQMNMDIGDHLKKKKTKPRKVMQSFKLP